MPNAYNVQVANPVPAKINFNQLVIKTVKKQLH